MDCVGGPFDRTSHTVDVRRVDSHRGIGWTDIPSVGLFVWRLRNYTVGWQEVPAGDTPPPSRAPAYCVEAEGPHCYAFSVLGNDTPLFTRPPSDASADRMPSELDLPAPIRRVRFAERPADYYGPGESLCVWAPDWPAKGAGMPVPASAIRVADLQDWGYHAPNGFVVVDPERGRMVFPVRQLPKQGVTAYYNYGFSADLGGGEYDRTLSQPADARIYFVGADGDYPTINAALSQWAADKEAAAPVATPASTDGPAPARASIAAVIEITDSAAYTEKLILQLDPYESLQIRAANGRRPTLRLLDYMAAQPDSLVVSGGASSRLTLDGLLITGRGMQVRGPDAAGDATGAGTPGDLCDIAIRHCTFVPGWGLDCCCDPTRPSEPSIEIFNSTAKIRIEHSIVGAIRITANEAATDPVELCVSDSFLDATDDALYVLNGPDDAVGYASLRIARCTVFGRVLVHQVSLAENCIFIGCLCVARRQGGCVRFCYVPPDSRTPRRYECQPDLVREAVEARFAGGAITAAERDIETRLRAGARRTRLHEHPVRHPGVRTARRWVRARNHNRRGRRVRDGRLSRLIPAPAGRQSARTPGHIHPRRNGRRHHQRNVGDHHARRIPRRLHPRHLLPGEPFLPGPDAAGPGPARCRLERAGSHPAPLPPRPRARPDRPARGTQASPERQRSRLCDPAESGAARRPHDRPGALLCRRHPLRTRGAAGKPERPARPRRIVSDAGAYPNPIAVPLTDNGLVYLDVWERHLVSAQQDSIREVALGGPDTASRAQVVWQVKLATEMPPENQDWPPADPAQANKYFDANWSLWTGVWQPVNRGLLQARVLPQQTSTDPCVISARSAYRGTENQLYRVEIQTGGLESAATPPTFKWSRENGSVVFPILSLATGSGQTTVTLASFGRDSRLSLENNDWVEVVDDVSSLTGVPRPLLQVQAVDRAAMTVTLGGTVAITVDQTLANHPLLRRWDHQAGDATQGGLQIEADGAALVVEGGWLNLEDGVQIQFQPGAMYRSGDYWLIPARVATGNVEWPQQADSQGKLVPQALPPHGIEHHYAPLGYFTPGVPNIVDLRRAFGPLAT